MRQSRRYKSWTVHGWTSPSTGLPGAEIHERSTGTTFRLAITHDEQGEPQIAEFHMQAREGDTITRGPLHAVPLMTLRDFAAQQVREDQGLGPGEVIIDLTHHDTDEGETAPLSARKGSTSDDDEADAALRAFAAFYTSLGPTHLHEVTPARREHGGVEYLAKTEKWPRRKALRMLPDSPAFGWSESKLDKVTAAARAAGLITSAPTKGRRTDLTPKTPGGTSSPGDHNK